MKRSLFDSNDGLNILSSSPSSTSTLPSLSSLSSFSAISSLSAPAALSTVPSLSSSASLSPSLSSSGNSETFKRLKNELNLLFPGNNAGECE